MGTLFWGTPLVRLQSALFQSCGQLTKQLQLAAISRAAIPCVTQTHVPNAVQDKLQTPHTPVFHLSPHLEIKQPIEELSVRVKNIDANYGFGSRVLRSWDTRLKPAIQSNQDADSSPLLLKSCMPGYQSRGHSSGSAPARSSSFGELTSDDVRFFQGVLGTGGVVTAADALEVANTDWMNKYHGKSKLLLRPKTTEQVSRVLKHCHDRRLAVVPQGGNSGLVGGSIPLFDEIILNLGAMDQIISFDEVSGILVCEAGCILETVDSYLAERGFVFPLDLGAKGSCQIGGNISTNAGGLRLLRYGSLHGTVLGLEAVLADGTVMDTLKTLRKDNTGYDLKQLLIGGEGTLGVITKAAVLTPPKARAVHVALLACNTFQNVLSTFKVAKTELGEILSAFEFFDRTCLDLVLKYHPDTRDPLPSAEEGARPPPFYLLLETAGSTQEHDSAKWDAFLEAAYSGGSVETGTVAQDASQAAGLWAIREGITESLAKNGVVYKYDLSLPVAQLYQLVEETQQQIGDLGVAVGYGHLGDGNLHLNVSASAYSDELLARLEPWVYEWTATQRGSISAEHGLGQMKAEALRFSKTDSAIKVMADLKQLLDPRGILNPYKVLPQASRQI